MSQSPALRLSFGVVSLLCCAVVLSDLFFGITTDPNVVERTRRTTLAGVVSAGVAQQVSSTNFPSNYRAIEQSLEAVRNQAPEILSVEVRTADGALVARSGARPVEPTTERLRVAIESSVGAWGEAEFSFVAAPESVAVVSLPYRRLWVVLALGAACVLMTYLYLRRALLVLDPTSVVPDRLRAAFDSLTEGLALLDPRHRVVMGNKALQEMAGIGSGALLGRRLEDVAQVDVGDGNPLPPWQTAMHSGQPVRGVRVHVGHGDNRRTGTLNCAPIVDALGKVRGCLVTLADMTAIERSNEQLRTALTEVEHAHALIETQNVELKRLALHDGLTGLLNRRAFFQGAGERLSRPDSPAMSCAVMMVNVDHFKTFNDRYGHATGDVVLQRVARCLEGTVRVNDLAARYGGEEFCVLAQGLDDNGAVALAERVRLAIEQEAGVSNDAGEALQVTVSIGVAAWPYTGGDLSALVKAADGALYASKRAGRNRVTLADLGQLTLSRRKETVPPQSST